MAHWLVKSLAQRGISWLPRNHVWNEFFQERVTRSLRLDYAAFCTRLEEGHRILDELSKLHPEGIARVRMLELGTGWFPTIPVALFLCGAEEVWTFDIVPLLRRRRLKRMVELFRECHEKGDLPRLLPRLQPRRVEALLQLESCVDHDAPADWLDRLTIRYRVQDAQQTGLSDASVDLIFSDAVLHHIPKPVLQRILAEFRRVASPDAVMIHLILLADQFAFFDHSITQFNFLQFTEQQWRWRASPLIWANRLRISDYRRLLSDAGFSLVREDSQSGLPADLGKVRLAPEFSDYAQADLLVTRSWMVATPSLSTN